ncbi:MAG TPA: ABC transporter substrate-binding protein [Spirochaetia bacterium]|nr:ABC transporter substrate-binding protein [Spirochaetia bacterium]
MKTSAIRVVLLLSTLLACAAPSWAAGPDKVVLAIGYIPHVQFTPLYVGIDKGFYAAQGIDLQLEFGFQYDIFSLLAAGKIDVGLSDSDQLVISGSRDLGLQAVFQYYQKYPISIVARAETVKTPDDLKGKTVGTPEMSGSAWIGLQLFLRKYGLEKSVSVEKIGYTQEPTLMSGRAAAVVCFLNNEPVAMKARGIALRQWDVKDWSDMVGASFISSRSIIAARPDVMARFVRATRTAMDFTMTHRDEAMQIALRNVGNVKKEDEPLFRLRLDATCDLFPSPRGFGALDTDQYARSISELASLGLIPATYPADKILRQF